MQNFYKTHGKHCYYRSFQTECPRCGVEVLFWECNHGCKVFFNYPPYGKLIRHICRQYKGNKIKNKYPIIIRNPNKMLEDASPSCPICGKIFKNESNLKEHLKQSKKNDQQYKQFFEGKFSFFNEFNHKTLIKSEKTKVSDKLKFGKINLRRRKQ